LLDVRCYSPDVDVLVKSGVTVGSGGSFSTTVDTTSFESNLCRIIAAPAGQAAPFSTADFSGPVIGNGQQKTYKKGATEADYYVSQPQLGAYVRYDSLGSCGICDMSLYGSDLASGSYVFGLGEAGLYGGEYSAGTSSYPYAQVDGVDVVSPGSSQKSVANLPALTYTHAVDPATGNTVLTEVDPLSKCADPASCTAYVPTGLRVERRIAQDHAGRVVRIVDTLRSTDGNAHGFSFAYDERAGSGISSDPGYRFPGESSYTAHADGDSVPGGPGAVSTIYAITDHTAAPSLTNPVGAITVSPAPDIARFRGSDQFKLVFTGTVPAGGTKTISQSFATGASQAEVDGYASQDEDQLSGPQVAITSPANGAKVGTSKVTVSGTASDNKAVTSLTVNGHAAPVVAGKWSVVLSLHTGANTITAVAQDAAGNQSTASSSVTYAPPPVATTVTVGKISAHRSVARAVLTCHAAAGTSCRGTVTLTKRVGHRTVTVGKASYKLTNGQKKTITVKLNRTGRALLRASARHRLTVRVTVRLGIKTIARHNVTLRG
jgi:hypothetical protein